MILSDIIVVVHLALKIAIMTSGLPTVPLLGKVVGGMELATIQTSMVCTSMVSPVMKQWPG